MAQDIRRIIVSRIEAYPLQGIGYWFITYPWRRRQKVTDPADLVKLLAIFPADYAVIFRAAAAGKSRPPAELKPE